jgi:chemotaxis protein MotB
LADHHPEIIIVKRRSAHAEEHHGGAWKIAFADFMTAMMAFFLVLWIINATDKNTKTIIARYFNPVKLENAAKSKKGIHGGAQPTPGPEKDGAKDPDPQDGAAAPTAENPDKPAPAGKDAAKSRQDVLASLATPADPAAPKAVISESQLLAEPYKSLDLIAEAQAQSNALAQPGAVVDAFRDPFRAIGPEIGGNGAEAREPPTAPIATPEPTREPPSPAGKPPVEAGGDRETRLAAAAAQLLETLRQRIGASSARPGPSVDVKPTDEGLLISLTDQLDFAMFPVGSSEPQGKVLQAMEAIAKTLQARPGGIVIRGHTDGRPYKSGAYDNWRLSSARAQMAYYMLTRAGLADSRFERIEGDADRHPRDAANPGAAENRRIEILLREVKP